MPRLTHFINVKGDIRINVDCARPRAARLMNVMGGKYHESQDATFVRITFTAGAYTNDKITLPRLDAIAARDKSGKVWLESLSSIRISQSM